MYPTRNENGIRSEFVDETACKAQESQIERALNGLMERPERLEKLLEVLEMRCMPVLSPCPPEGRSLLKTGEGLTESPMAATLRVVGEHIDRVESRLQSIIQRIDL
jgi:hypothetical protein